MSRSDRRFSSYAHEIDAAIERVVTHFEENDVALRLDVLRGLATHAKLAFETERVKQRLAQHPVTKDLIESVGTTSTAFARLHDALVVEEYSCDYDRQRNVEMRATVRWTLPAYENKTLKKKHKTGKRRARDETPLFMRYTFTRTTDRDNGETMIVYAVAAGVGIESEMQEFVRYELASDAPYPRSFYEEDQGMGSDEEHSDEEESSKKVKDNGAASDEENEEPDTYGEEIRGFAFNDAVMDMLLEWLHAEEEELEPADAIGFFMSLPMYEDDWMIDERVCQILFGGPGGECEMEEEIVSDFDDDDGEGEDDADLD